MGDEYRLLDCGEEQKLEQIGPYRVVRQAAQAHWPKTLAPAEWDRVDAVHVRTKGGGGYWTYRNQLPESWTIHYCGHPFLVRLTDFGHIGLFPEQWENWQWLARCCETDAPDVLNLFGYTGASSYAAARAGAKVTHVDASKGIVSWGRENQSPGEDLPIRWIVEDVGKYLARETRRGKRYQGIVLDPPSFGRGPKGQVWKIETDLVPLLNDLRALAAPMKFILLSCHTPGYSPLCLKELLLRVYGLPVEEVEAGEMTVPVAGGGHTLPSGTYARWHAP
jgi:23S rRNA (cytosine1962-C5)-methyltransferase